MAFVSDLDGNTICVSKSVIQSKQSWPIACGDEENILKIEFNKPNLI
jgi:hypothetical protein